MKRAASQNYSGSFGLDKLNGPLLQHALEVHALLPEPSHACVTTPRVLLAFQFLQHKILALHNADNRTSTHMESTPFGWKTDCSMRLAG